jgi:hypothetical protein
MVIDDDLDQIASMHHSFIHSFNIHLDSRYIDTREPYANKSHLLSLIIILTVSRLFPKHQFTLSH